MSMSSRSWRRVSCNGPGSGSARARVSRMLVMYSALKAWKASPSEMARATRIGGVDLGQSQDLADVVAGAVLIGLIGHLVGTPLQDDIVRTTDRLLRLGQDILATSAARAATPVPDCGAGRDRLRDVLQNPRLP